MIPPRLAINVEGFGVLYRLGDTVSALGDTALHYRHIQDALLSSKTNQGLMMQRANYVA
jgi:hypothetical protein